MICENCCKDPCSQYPGCLVATGSRSQLTNAADPALRAFYIGLEETRKWKEVALRLKDALGSYVTRAREAKERLARRTDLHDIDGKALRVAMRKQREMAKELETVRGELADAMDIIKIVETDIGGDRPDSLTHPVVMSADTLRGLVGHVDVPECPAAEPEVLELCRHGHDIPEQCPRCRTKPGEGK